MRAGALTVVLALLGFSQEKGGSPLQVSGEDLRPGLVGAYRSLSEGGGSMTRVDVKPAFTLGHSSPHPRIAPGPFEVTWSGVFVMLDGEPVTFDAWAGGEVRVAIDGVTVLEGKGATDAAHVKGTVALDRRPGPYPIEIRYRSVPGVPARLQIGWEGRTFARETLPAWRLKHLVKDRPEAEELAQKGREAVVKLGCARCHAGAFPGVDDPPQGPSLADVGDRAGRTWLLAWLDDPAKMKSVARMPSLFSNDRIGLVERWIVTDYLLRATSTGQRREATVQGDHRMGKRHFSSLGCATCHFLPDEDRADQIGLDRIPLEGLNDRMSVRDFVAFLGNPHARYPDGRMPRLPVQPQAAR